MYGRQGIFGDYQVGTLTVPGGLALLRPPAPMTPGDTHGGDHWGQVRPPDVAALSRDDTLPVSPANAGMVAPTEQPFRQPAAPARSGDRPAGGGLPAAAVVAVLLLGAAVGGSAVLGGALLLGRSRVARAVPWWARTTRAECGARRALRSGVRTTARR